MNNKGDGSSYNIAGYNRYSVISDLQSGHANIGSSESDLVSGKMKEVVTYNIIVI